MRRLGLPDAGDVVEFTLHRHERHIADRFRPHRSAAMRQKTARQEIGLEHDINGLQIELFRQVQDR